MAKELATQDAPTIIKQDKSIIWLLVLVLPVLFSCALGETLTELSSLQNAIEEEYGSDGSLGASYSIATGTGKSVKIEWENSTAFSVNDPDIEEKTDELAQFVYDHYAGIDDVENVWIVLVESQNFLIFHSSHTRQFVYSVDELDDSETSE